MSKIKNLIKHDDCIDLIPDFILGDISLHKKTPAQVLNQSEYIKFLKEKQKLLKISSEKDET